MFWNKIHYLLNLINIINKFKYYHNIGNENYICHLTVKVRFYHQCRLCCLRKTTSTAVVAIKLKLYLTLFTKCLCKLLTAYEQGFYFPNLSQNSSGIY